MSYEAAKEMTLGQLVDYVIEYNSMMEKAAKKTGKDGKKQATIRKATQADWDALFG